MEKEKNVYQMIKEEPRDPSKRGKLKIFIAIGVSVTLFISIYYLISYEQHFDYKGLKFYIDENKLENMTLYRTPIPVIYEDTVTGRVTYEDYDVYFMKDPREIENITFYGRIVTKKKMILNITEEFSCTEEDFAAVKNLINVYNIIGTNVVRDEISGCDDIYGRYSWVNILKGNKTEITQWGLKETCYNLYVKDCEISEAVEKFLLETLIEINEIK